MPSTVQATQPKKLLVLDIDETILHTSFKQVDDYDFKLEIQLKDPSNPYKLSQVTAYVQKRPYIEQFLRRM